jgi:putative component of toxin-antitoxin plasmid stabilization module
MLLRILYRGQMTVCAYFLLCCFDQSSRMNEIKATVLEFCAFLDAHRVFSTFHRSVSRF